MIIEKVQDVQVKRLYIHKDTKRYLRIDDIPGAQPKPLKHMENKVYPFSKK